MVEGFRNGFSIKHYKIIDPIHRTNHPSAYLRPNLLATKIQKELLAGWFAGPFPDPPFRWLVVNPLGLVPKMDELGWDRPQENPTEESSYRMIMDLRRSGVNAGIEKEDSSVQYIKFDFIVQRCLELGRGCHLVKTDIKSAFWIIPITKRDWPFLCMTYKGQYLVDKCLPFGLSTSCAIFEEFTTALESIIQARLTSGTLHHYLEDFIGNDCGQQPANQILRTTIQVCQELGVTTAPEKTLGNNLVEVSGVGH